MSSIWITEAQAKCGEIDFGQEMDINATELNVKSELDPISLMGLEGDDFQDNLRLWDQGLELWTNNWSI